MVFLRKKKFKTFNFFLLCLVLIGLIAALRHVSSVFSSLSQKQVAKVETPERSSSIPQFVIISFDGSRDNELWKDLRNFKADMKKEGKRVNFTHFINTAYFLTKETKSFYTAPRHTQGHSNIGVASDVNEIHTRVNEVNRAIADGDEIEPHTTGHFSGRGWTKDEWKRELDSFDGILFGLDKLYPNSGFKINLKPEDIVGFRAPYLETSVGLYEMLHENPRYTYDTSGMGVGNEWPKKDDKGLWRIPLGTLFIGSYRIPVLAMDYNLYEHHTHAQDWMKKDTDEWKRAYTDTLGGWREYFNRNYSGVRAPVLVGYHFEKWNDGVYWQAMKDFAREVCGMPEVRCGTFKELVKYMEEYGVPR